MKTLGLVIPETAMELERVSPAIEEDLLRWFDALRHPSGRSRPGTTP
jgi:hypothetical protein